MLRTAIKLLPFAILTLAACLPNPEGPSLDPPGAPPSEFVANFDNIQINGDFSGINWDPTDLRHYLNLEADHRWAIWVSVLESDYADGEIRFKFTHEANWAPDNFGAGTEPGELILESGDPPHCVIEMDGPPGFYKVWMDDEAMRYSSELVLASGGIEGNMNFEGPDPPSASLAITALNEHGDAALWTVDANDMNYEIANLADSLYTVIATATGYGSLSEDIRVSGGQMTFFEFEFGEPLDSVEPDQPWTTPIIDGVLEDGWIEVYDDDGHVGLWNLVNMDYDALHTAWDGDSLYLAVSGNFAGTFNSLNIYIDADYGSGSGLTDLSLIAGAEEYVTVISRLKKQVDFSELTGFGVEFATSTWGHSEAELSSLSPTGTAAPLDHGAISISENVMEMAIPWSVLYPDIGGEGAVPPFAHVAIFALIGSTSDTAMSDDSLPFVENLNAPDAIIAIPVDQDGQ